MGKAKDLINSKFGRLTVVSKSENQGINKDRTAWFCQCECGKTTKVRSDSLTGGKTTSCGCYSIEVATRLKTIHGMIGTPTHNSWSTMKQRCVNQNSPKYHYYGGRGIKVCERWQNFENFYEDMGKRPKNKTLDRIDNTKGYSKENCKWSTASEQSINQRISVRNNSGRVGVQMTSSGRWKAVIGFQGSAKHLGVCDDFEDACKLRDQGELKYYGKLLNDTAK